MNYKSKLHHLIIFKDNLSGVKDRQQNHYVQSIINQIPILMVDLIEMERTGDNRSLEMPVFQNPRASTGYVILQDEEFSLLKVYDTLYRFVAISPTPTRPKCLLMLFSNDKDWSENQLKQVLRYAWSLKFLDFSILKFMNTNHVMHFYYNPFMDVYYKDYLDTMVDIFPDKLNNMNKFPLKMLLYRTHSLLVHTDDNGEIILVNGSSNTFLKTLSKKLNFMLHFVPLDHNSSFEYCLSTLENNTMNMLPTYFMVNAHLYGKEIVMGNFIGVSKLVFLVPIMVNFKVHFSLNVIFNIICFLLVLLIFIIVINLPALRSEKVRILNIFQIFLGISTLQPPGLKARVIFATMAILSVVYSGEFFSNLNEIKFTKHELQFDTFEDFLNSKLTIYSTLEANPYDNEEIKN